MTVDKTAVFLTDADSAKLVIFLKYYPILSKIIEVVEQKKGAGSITIHFDHTGMPRMLDKLDKITLV